MPYSCIACLACLFTAGSALKLHSVPSNSQLADPSADVYDMICDESAASFDADACFKKVVGRTKADLQKHLNEDPAITSISFRRAMPICTRYFYTYTFDQFDMDFPYVAKCGVSVYAAVVHAAILADPCRTSNKSAADFLVPPPYLAQDCNWPVYGGGHCLGANSFRQGHRCKGPVAKAFVEMQKQSGNKSVLVIDQNSEWIPYNLPAVEYSRSGWMRAKVNSKLPHYRPDVDISLPPPATARCKDVREDAFDEPLEAKRYFVSFKGRLSSKSTAIRQEVRRVLHNGRDRIIADTKSPKHDFDLLLRSSRFLPIMGGDVEFSYRFNEAVCSGGVPVLITNTWIPPFHEFVPFESYGVLVNETQVEDLLHILQSLPDTEVEARRKMARKMCVDAFQTTEKTISALLHFLTSADSRRSVL